MPTLEDDLLGLIGGNKEDNDDEMEEDDGDFDVDDDDDDDEDLDDDDEELDDSEEDGLESSKRGRRKKKTNKKRGGLADSEDDDESNLYSDDNEGVVDEGAVERFPLKKRGKLDSSSGVGRSQTTSSSAKKRNKGGDSDSESVEFNLSDYEDGFGDDLMGDEEDRQRLMAMNELDREMELFERQERRDELRRKKEIMLELKAQRDEKKERSRSTRTQKSGKAKYKGALEELVARRQKKGSSGKRRAAKATSQEEDEYDDYMDYEDESDDYLSDEDRKGRRRRRRKDWDPSLEDGELDGEYDIEASLEDIQAVAVKRELLVQWHKEPYFEDVMVGQFVRLAIGSTVAETGNKKSVYRLAKITEVVERPPGKYQTFANEPYFKSPYDIGGGATTSKWLKVRIGKSEASFPIIIVSNSPVEESEFNFYCEQLQEAGLKQPMKHECNTARASQEQGRDFRYTEEDVKRLIEQRRRSASYKTVNYAAEKQRLTGLLDWANQEEDESKVEEYTQALERLEEFHRKEKLKLSKGQSMMDINKRNAERNFELLAKAKAATEGRKALGDTDPFSRRATNPINYWSTKKQGKKESDEGKDLSALESGGKEEVEPEDNPEDYVDPTKFPGIEFDLKVDVSLLDLPRQNAALALSNSGNQVAVSGKTLSLADYMKRQGLV